MDKEELLRQVAAGIKTRRKAKGMTIAELAEAASIDTGFLSHVETASRAPSLTVLAALLKALGISAGDLFQGQARKNSEQTDELTRRTRALLKKLGPRDQDALIAIFGKLKSPAEIRALRVLLRA